jgi:hypothetical protein
MQGAATQAMSQLASCLASLLARYIPYEYAPRSRLAIQLASQQQNESYL